MLRPYLLLITSKMILFRHLQPSQKFQITIIELAKILHIPPSVIVRIELWAYVIFIHRRDRGGQFFSYRKLHKWQCAVACQIQKCTDEKQLKKLWLAIQKDYKKYRKQYQPTYPNFIRKIWTQHWDKISQSMSLASIA